MNFRLYIAAGTAWPHHTTVAPMCHLRGLLKIPRRPQRSTAMERWKVRLELARGELLRQAQQNHAQWCHGALEKPLCHENRSV